MKKRMVIPMINVIFNQFDYEISERKKEIWDRYNKVIQWGRQHPLRFAEKFLGIEFTDHQKYVFLSSTPFILTKSIPLLNSNIMFNISHLVFNLSLLFISLFSKTFP